ncbi:MAG: FecR domain-containing protein [Acidobacteria bacterium]|nr:FecR domain-containing protein [Acidobacteriota bacterium]
MSFRKSWLLVSLLLGAFVMAQAASHVRIVRLSYVNGQVQVDRGNGAGYDQAMPNMPVVEGLKFSTGADGVAELEFEDGSTLRITPGTEIQIRELALGDSGGTVSSVAVLHGTAYVDFRKRKDDTFTLALPGHDVQLTHAVRMRAEVAQDEAELAVFNGQLEMTSAGESIVVKKNETATLDFTNSGRLTLARSIEPAPYDDWSNEREKYRERYATQVASNRGAPAYGLADLAYYGSGFDLAGYGWVWQPFGIGYGWDPFSSGYWNYYPTTGWLWGSYSPWGWYPYRYGTWIFAPGYGWVWSPGTGIGITTWRPIPPVNGAPPGYKPPTAPTAPASAARALVAVGTPPVHGPGNRIYDPSDPALALNKGKGGVNAAAAASASGATAPSANVREMRRAMATPANQAALAAMRTQDTFNQKFHQQMEVHAAAYAHGAPGGEPSMRSSGNHQPGAAASGSHSPSASGSAIHSAGPSPSMHAASGGAGSSMGGGGGAGPSISAGGGGSHPSGGGGGGKPPQ